MGVWRDGILGLVIGDALGCPVEFQLRKDLKKNSVTGMREYGTHYMPAGTWTDDSSMALATLDSIEKCNGIDLNDIMGRFVQWLENGQYTPSGYAFDAGITTEEAISRYQNGCDVQSCGGNQERDNGNGSLMRILPACLYCGEAEQKGALSEEKAVSLIHQVSALTHQHLRSEMACGLYYYMVKAILEGKKEPAGGALTDCLQKGLDQGFAFYKEKLETTIELSYFSRLQNLYKFRDLPDSEIRSRGYVIDTIEASVWSLLTTTTYKQAMLTAVNLGADTDTVAAIAGGLGGLYYGEADIPEEWLSVIRRREWIEGLCEQADHLDFLYRCSIPDRM